MVMGTVAAAVAGHHLAADAALDMMKQGGNAADAAVAACAVLSVVKPDACALGSDLFVLYFDAGTQRSYALNASGPAARAAGVHSFPEGRIPLRGSRSASVPGAVDGWCQLLERFGHLGDRARALAPAVALAEKGFPISAYLCRSIRRHADVVRASPELAASFMPYGDVPTPGTVAVQVRLAETLGDIAAHGADAFYRGRVAASIDEATRAGEGLLRLDDFGDYRSEWLEPLGAAYRDLHVLGSPPVSRALVAVLALAILDGFEGSVDAPVRLRRQVRAFELANEAVERLLGDPRFVPTGAADLLAQDFVARCRKEIAVGRQSLRPAPEADTSCVMVVDARGNAAACIQSVRYWWGSGYVVPGTGCLMNDRMIDFSLDPDHPNFLQGGKRTMNTLSPLLVLRSGRPHLVMGSPGAYGQVQTLVQLAQLIVDDGVDVQSAVEAPRWLLEAGSLSLEPGFDATVAQAAGSLGHEVTMLAERSPLMGGAQIIRIDDQGVLQGAADPRREAYAVAY
jgi:gamma-glutamyltranspeptidase/glutathione hydrolase